jgi:spermidine synthase
MSSGLYSKPNLIRELGKEKFLHALSQMKILYIKEGVNAHVSVVEGAGQRAIRINGKVVATTTAIDMSNQMALAHIPMLLNDDPQRTMIVGLGAGVTAGHLASYKPESLDIVEIEPAVLGASKTLADINGSPWTQEGVNIIYADGRNYVLAGVPGYDVITSDPIHPYAQGAGSLYTVEHFRNCMKLLNDDGVMAQWLPLYGMSDADSRSIVASFCEVFPHASYWVAPNPKGQATFKRDAILIGSRQPLEIDVEMLEMRLQHPKIAEMVKPYGWHEPAAFISGFLMQDKALRAYASGATLNTDNYPVIEYGAPKGLFLETETSKEKLSNGALAAAGGSLPALKVPEERQESFFTALAERLRLIGREAQAERAEALRDAAAPDTTEP